MRVILEPLLRCVTLLLGPHLRGDSMFSCLLLSCRSSMLHIAMIIGGGGGAEQHLNALQHWITSRAGQLSAACRGLSYGAMGNGRSQTARPSGPSRCCCDVKFAVHATLCTAWQVHTICMGTGCAPLMQGSHTIITATHHGRSLASHLTRQEHAVGVVVTAEVSSCLHACCMA